MHGFTTLSSKSNGRIVERDTRDWRDGRDGRQFKVRSSRFSELQILNFIRWLLSDTMLPPV
jgi:hypothetical protein